MINQARGKDTRKVRYSMLMLPANSIYLHPKVQAKINLCLSVNSKSIVFILRELFPVFLLLLLGKSHFYLLFLIKEVFQYLFSIVKFLFLVFLFLAILFCISVLFENSFYFLVLILDELEYLFECEAFVCAGIIHFIA
jgi:hypothetical protein